MILQALQDYYQRRQTDPDPTRRLPAFGLEQKEIGFILELDSTGALKAISDTRRQLGNKKIGTSYLVPKGTKKTSGVAANLLWDNAEYVLGVPDEKKFQAAKANGKEDKYCVRLLEMQEAFRDRIRSLPAQAAADVGIGAVRAFLDAQPAEQVRRFEVFAEIGETNPVLSFRLVQEDALICQRPSVMSCLGCSEHTDVPSQDARDTLCLVTGAQAPSERLHSAIKGVWGAQTSGANIVSFNLDAFNSYGKSQGDNAPVSQAAAFAYTTALNALLARDSTQRVQIGDASTVFWAQRPDPMEDWLADLIGGDNPDAHAQQVRALLDSVRTGCFDGGRGENRFYVLGLAPNAARIAVQFWHAAPLSDIAHRIAAWFDDLRMVRSPNDAAYPSLFRLLKAVAVQGKTENIPPRLGGDIVRSIFAGTPFPATWLSAGVQRCRAERQVNHLRAAALKACLNRDSTSVLGRSDHHHWEIKEMLDPDNPSAGYRLGRVFATLEKIQEEASPGLNATIRERYYGAASSTPVAVFTTLMRLKNHHLAKLGNKGRTVNFEKLLAEIMSGVSDFPVHLTLQEQGRFAIGYYHQRQDFFAKREAVEAEAAADTTTQGGN